MSFSKKKINTLLDKKVIRKSKIPILVNDDNWKKIIAKNSNLRLKFFSEKLKKVINKEKKLIIEQKSIKNEKQVLLKEILLFSNLINTEEEERSLDRISVQIENNKEKIELLNKNLEKIYRDIENIPIKTEEINLDLLIETIKVSYKSLNKALDKLAKANGEVARIRRVLDELRKEKESHEENIELYYSFLHGMLGHKEMEKLDIKLLQDHDEVEEKIE
ncbi:MAG: hypothetical protein COA82_02765 [Alkaliphilus sp.]|nr:hypothetical protein [bacterium AH-315-G05]PHS35960.1 MAG: hypothetical protein COA82_02765 [Alkaliphilus sp.]